MRIAICGEIWAEAAATLGLEGGTDRPDAVLLDLGDPAAVAAASGVDPSVRRIAFARDEHLPLLRALGDAGFMVAASPTAAAIGPLIARLEPKPAPKHTSLILITGVAGGSGRTLLAVGLALRLATRGSVALIDLTGSGAAAWWLRLDPPPWSDLEGLVDELTAEHLAVIAAERDGVRLLGGSGSVPSTALAVAASRAALGIADLVIVDAPLLHDERTRAVGELADRTLVVASADPVTRAALSGSQLGEHWLVASRVPEEQDPPSSSVRSLPEDPGSVHSTAERGGQVGGALGRAHDELAELLAIDATAP